MTADSRAAQCSDHFPLQYHEKEQISPETADENRDELT